jgi:nucleoside-diphosphate-sugar epimerase
LHDDDLVSATRLLLAGSTPRGPRAWNLARSEAIAIRDYVAALAGAAGRPAELVPIDYAALGVAPRAFFPYRDYACVLDTSAIERELGWRAPVALAAGLARTLSAYRVEVLAAPFTDHAVGDELLARRAVSA